MVNLLGFNRFSVFPLLTYLSATNWSAPELSQTSRSSSETLLHDYPNICRQCVRRLKISKEKTCFVFTTALLNPISSKYKRIK